MLARAGVKPQAKYAVFYCADSMEGIPTTSAMAIACRRPGRTRSSNGAAAGSNAVRYYESLDLIDATHPQTILAYEMNGKPLPIPYGAPLRLRVERQLGYKMAKYLMRIELVDDFAGIGDGSGGYWEDQGYEWFAGI